MLVPVPTLHRQSNMLPAMVVMIKQAPRLLLLNQSGSRSLVSLPLVCLVSAGNASVRVFLLT